MPKFVNLSPEEKEEITRRRVGTTVNMEPYIQFIRGFNTGEYGEIILNEGDRKRIEKKRISHAATALNKDIIWIRPQGERILFKVR